MAMKLRLAVGGLVGGGFGWAIQCEQADGSFKDLASSVAPIDTRDEAVAAANELLATLDAQGIGANGLPVVDEDAG